MRRFDPHPLGRVLDLFLVEDEADVAILVERREREHGDQHADRARQDDLRPAHEPVVAAARARAQRCFAAALADGAASAIVGENVLLGPAGEVEQRASRQEIEAGLRKRRPLLALEPLVELLLELRAGSERRSPHIRAARR